MRISPSSDIVGSTPRALPSFPFFKNYLLVSPRAWLKLSFAAPRQLSPHDDGQVDLAQPKSQLHTQHEQIRNRKLHKHNGQCLRAPVQIPPTSLLIGCKMSQLLFEPASKMVLFHRYQRYGSNTHKPQRHLQLNFKAVSTAYITLHFITDYSHCHTLNSTSICTDKDKTQTVIKCFPKQRLAPSVQPLVVHYAQHRLWSPFDF